MLLAASIVVLTFEGFAEQVSAMPTLDLENAPRTPGGGISLLKGGSSSEDATFSILEGLGEEDVFLDVAGQDVLKWGTVKRQMEALQTPFPMRADMGEEGRAAALKMGFRMKFRKLMRDYIKYAVIAVEARRCGITADESEFSTERVKSQSYFKSLGKVGEKHLEMMSAPESFYEHNLTNALLWRAYMEQVVKPSIAISDDEITERIKLQEELNVAALATNEFKRIRIGKILRRVRPSDPSVKAIPFSKAAKIWSECPTADTGGVFTDVDEKPQQLVGGELRQELEMAYDSLKPGEISDVIETPYSWHILKLLKRNKETEDEEASVEVAHIMLEKVIMGPILTEDDARRRLMNAKVRIAMNDRLVDLLDTTKITCPIPIFDAKKMAAKANKTGGPE